MSPRGLKFKLIDENASYKESSKLRGFRFYMSAAFCMRTMAKTRRQSVATFVAAELLSFRNLART